MSDAQVLSFVEVLIALSLKSGGLNNGSMTRLSAPLKKNKGLRTLLRELSDDENDAAMDTGLDVLDDPQRPWLHDYRAYVDVLEQVPEGWTAIQWWGVSISD